MNFSERLMIISAKTDLSPLLRFSEFMEVRRSVDNVFDPKNQISSLAILSFLPGEGKTLFSLLAACSLSQRHLKRVLLLDTVSRPRRGHLWIPRLWGLTERKAFEPYELSIESTRLTYVWLPLIPNGRLGFEQEVFDLQKKFDVTLVDTVPLLNRSRQENDPIQMAAFAKKAILLRGPSSFEQNPRVFLSPLKDLGVSLLGVVSNHGGSQRYDSI